MQAIRILGLAMVLCLVGCRRTPSLDGMWDATVTRGSTEVPFRFAIEGKGDNLRGSFFNGDDKITSTSASVHGDTVVFRYPEYGTTLEVTATVNGRLEGLYTYNSDESYRVEAQRFTQPHFGGAVPTIEGLWTIGGTCQEKRTGVAFDCPAGRS